MTIRTIGELEAAARAQARVDYATQLRQRVAELKQAMRCNCDLDNWEPEANTGHSWVCRIHKAAVGG